MYGRRSTASSTLAMFGWSIRARACRSASKRAMTCRESMPGLMSLTATQALDRLGLLGHPDRAHAAFADLLQQLVGADLRAGALGGRLVHRRRRVLQRTALQEAAGCLVRLSRASTRARKAASAPQACCRNAARSAGLSMSRARVKMANSSIAVSLADHL